MAIYSSRLRLALPQGRDLDVICDHLRTCGFDLPELDSPGLYPVEDPSGSGVGFDIFKMPSTLFFQGLMPLGVIQ